MRTLSGTGFAKESVMQMKIDPFVRAALDNRWVCFFVPRSDPYYLRCHRAAFLTASITVFAGIHSGHLQTTITWGLLLLFWTVSVTYYTTMLGSWRRLSQKSRRAHFIGYAISCALLMGGQSIAPLLRALHQ